MAEMCSGVALFPGINDVVDQLDRIFSIRGVPDLEKWPEVKDLPNYATFHFTQYSELEWSQVDTQLGRLPDDGDLLLSTFLQVFFNIGKYHRNLKGSYPLKPVFHLDRVAL